MTDECRILILCFPAVFRQKVISLESFLVSSLWINIFIRWCARFAQLLGFHVFYIISVFFRWDILYILWNLSDKQPPCWPEAEWTGLITVLRFNSAVWHITEHGRTWITWGKQSKKGGTTTVTECLRGGRGGAFGSFADFGCVPPHSGLNPALSDDFMSQRMRTCWLSQMQDNYTKQDTQKSCEMKVTHWHSELMIDYITMLFASTRLQEEN